MGIAQLHPLAKVREVKKIHNCLVIQMYHSGEDYNIFHSNI